MTKSKLLAAALAVALCAPQAAFAARDGEGMEYTSASEGFYGSIRTYYSSNTGDTNNGGQITADSSRLGVRGSLDLGHGLTGLYRYEWSIDGENGDPVGNTRLSYVGLRGGFGEFQAGSLWENDYNWVTAATDIATTGSGNFAPHFRRKNQFQYTTPDVNGFQASFRFGMDGASENGGAINASGSLGLSELSAGSATLTLSGFGGTYGVPITSNMHHTDIAALIPGEPATVGDAERLTYSVNAASKGSETVDEWALAGKYSTHGFTFGAAYEVAPDRRGYQTPVESVNVVADPSRANVSAYIIAATDGFTVASVDEDHTFWAFRFGYGQDNWGVNAWYGKHNTADRGTPTNVAAQQGGESIAVFNARRIAALRKGLKPDDTTVFSIAGNIDMGKIALVAIYEQQENLWAQEDNVFLLNADYKFTSRSKAYIAYIANDFQTNPNKDDEVRIGLRMDF
ncbi:MAG: porin [Gammaproteobacteria bacterium]